MQASSIRWGDTSTLALPGTGRGESDTSSDLVDVPKVYAKGGRSASARVWALSIQIENLDAPFPGALADRSLVEVYTGCGSAMQVHRIPTPLAGTFGPFYYSCDSIRAKVILASSEPLALRRQITLAVAPFGVYSATEIPF